MSREDCKVCDCPPPIQSKGHSSHYSTITCYNCKVMYQKMDKSSTRKSQKKSHSTLRAKRATFTFLVNKSWLNMAYAIICGQTVLPDSSVFNRQKFLENVILWCVFCSLCKGSRVVTLKPNFTSKCQGKRAKFSPSFWQMVGRIPSLRWFLVRPS